MSKVRCVQTKGIFYFGLGQVYEKVRDCPPARIHVRVNTHNTVCCPAECFEPVEERAKAPTPETPTPAVPSIEHMTTFLAASDIDKEEEDAVVSPSVDAYYSLDALAVTLGLPLPFLRRLAHKGKLPRLDLGGGRFRYDVAEVKGALARLSRRGGVAGG